MRGSLRTRETGQDRLAQPPAERAHEHPRPMRREPTRAVAPSALALSMRLDTRVVVRCRRSRAAAFACKAVRGQASTAAGFAWIQAVEVVTTLARGASAPRSAVDGRPHATSAFAPYPTVARRSSATATSAGYIPVPAKPRGGLLLSPGCERLAVDRRTTGMDDDRASRAARRGAVASHGGCRSKVARRVSATRRLGAWRPARVVAAPAIRPALVSRPACGARASGGCGWQ